MSRPRFLADHDLNEHIIDGVMRREPRLEFIRVRDLSLDGAPDDQVLSEAAARGLIVVSHDVNTMAVAARGRLERGKCSRG
jgi:predicted nuclease of predicted toxin-antitoxin system